MYVRAGCTCCHTLKGDVLKRNVSLRKYSGEKNRYFSGYVLTRTVDDLKMIVPYGDVPTKKCS